MAFAFTLILLVAIVSATASHKLNVPKVLLPYRSSRSSPPINFTLEISDLVDRTSACFQWRSSRPEVAEIHPIFERSNPTCASRAIVSAVSEQSSRRTAIVSAEDFRTGTNLRCDVMVDSVDSLEIVTTTRQLYLEDSPELFIVRAKNSEGDTFADLDGLVFDWTIESASALASEIDHRHAPPARIVSFADSDFESTDAILRLESKRLRGDRILVEGVSTGVAIITVHSSEEAYRTNVDPYSIQLTVMAFLSLEPSADIRIPIGSRVHYLLKLIRYRKAETIRLPSKQYRIVLENIEPASGVEVARFNDQTSVLEALALGNVRLTVEDKKLDNTIAIYDLPTAYVYVVEPASIHFAVSTGVWVFEIGRSYEVIIELLDPHGRALFMTENTVIDVYFPSGLLKASQISLTNGTFWRIVAMKEGSNTIKAKYDSYLDVHGKQVPYEPAIQGQQFFEIYPSLSIVPPSLVFPPCYGAVDKCFEHRLTVHGGSGEFVWTLEATTGSLAFPAAKVNVHGNGERDATVWTSEGGPTSAVVTAADTKNRLHKASAKVIVTEPTKADFVDGSREVEIGSTLLLGLRLYGLVRVSEEHQVAFTDCQHLAFDVRSSNVVALEVAKTGLDEGHEAKTGPDSACAIFAVIGRSIGDVTVSVTVPTHGNVDGVVTATVSISVYAPLKLVSPTDNQLLLTPTSSYAIVFSGGPRPWLADPSAHFVAIERLGKAGVDYFETSDVTAASVGDRDPVRAYKVTVSCLSGTPTPTESSLQISVGNKETSANKFPALSVSKLRLICDFPTSLTLQLKRNRRPSDHLILPPCSLDQFGEAVSVYHGEKFDLLANLFDSTNRKFDNVSALLFTWRISDSAILRSPSNRARALQWRSSGDIDYEFYETFQPTGSEGEVKVTAEVGGLIKEACSVLQEKSCEDFLRRSLRVSALLRLVPFATLTPSVVILYSHPQSRAAITVHGGSGQFFVTTDNKESRTVSWNLVDFGRMVEVKPGNTGVGEANLQVYDVCLTEAPPATAAVAVTSIEKLVLVGPTLVMLAKQLTLRIQAFDGANRQISMEDVLGFLPLDVAIDGTGLTRKTKRESSPAVLLFDATDVGVVGVSVSVSDPISGNVYRSPIHRVQIFPSLEVEPKSIALIAGARFQIRITGGLHYSQITSFIDPASSGVTFSVNDSKPIIVGPDGLIEAKRPGSVTVTARMSNPEQRDEILGEDTVVVRVIQLASIRIHAPTTTIYTGSRIPLAFVGHSHRDQLSNAIDHGSLEATLPWGVSTTDFPLKASWSVDGDGAAIDAYNIDYISGSVYLNCIKPGVVHVRISVTQSDPHMAKLQFAGGVVHQSFRAILNASLTVTVVDELRFSEFKHWRHNNDFPPRLLLSHNASAPLRFTSPLRNLRYRKHHNDHLINTDDNGLIRSAFNRDRSGDVSVTATGLRTDVSDFDETAVFVVSVYPVAYLLPTFPHFHLWPNTAFSINYSLKWTINQHDARGRRFDAVSLSSNLAMRPNRFDLVDASLIQHDGHNILALKLKKIGETIIKIWDINYPNTVFDYLRINAIQAIQPAAATLTIGQKVNFSNVLSGWNPGSEIFWTCSDPAVLDIDEKWGFALAKAPGHATVSQKMSGFVDQEFISSTTVMVSEPSSISISKISGPKAFVDIDDAAEYLFAVKFDGQPKETAAGNLDLVQRTKEFSLGSLFRCEMRLSPTAPVADSRFFRIEPAYVSSIGFACVLKKLSPWTTLITSVDAERNISIWASRGNFHSETLTYPIYGPIKVQPSVELMIDNVQSPKALVRILAPNHDRLSRIKVALSNDARDLFTMKSATSSKSDQQLDSASRKEFVLRLRPDAAVDLAAIRTRSVDYHLAILDETTNIIQRLPIRLKLVAKISAADEARGGGILGALWDLLVAAKDGYGVLALLLVSVASIFFGYKALTNRTASTSAASAVPSISPASVPWRSYGGQGVRSPQLWSVERSQTSPSTGSSPLLVSPGSSLTKRLIQ